MDEQKQLLATIRKLRELNQFNQQLTEHSLKYINYSLDLLAGSSDDEVIYHNPHQQLSSSMKPNRLFDTKA